MGGPRVGQKVGHLADQMEGQRVDRRVGRWADRREGPKVDRLVDRKVGHWVDRREDRREGPKVDRMEDRMEGRMEDRRADRWADRKVGPKVDRLGGQTVARTVGLVALQAAWVEALVLGLWEPPVAQRLRMPGSAAREAGLLRVQRPAVIQQEGARGRGASNQPQGLVPQGV